MNEQPPRPSLAAEIDAATRIRRERDELLFACEQQHQAIDMLFAQLAVLTQKYTPDDVFMPSASGAPWNALVIGNAAIARARGKS